MRKEYSRQTLSSSSQSKPATLRHQRFLANLSPSLSTQKTEDQLELSCHEAFDVYGPNHIKIRRDKNRHPFAFVQYEVRLQKNKLHCALADHGCRTSMMPMLLCLELTVSSWMVARFEWRERRLSVSNHSRPFYLASSPNKESRCCHSEQG